jgi:capsule polysaccharide export protein KpsE/RkpR
MSNTVEKTVATYVQLNDREALEELKTYRQKLAVHLKARTSLDFSLLIHQIDAEITVIEAGLDNLGAPSALSTAENASAPNKRAARKFLAQAKELQS